MDLKLIDKFYYQVEGIFMGSYGLAILEMVYEPNRFNMYVVIATLSIGIVVKSIAWYIRFKKLKANFIQSIKP